MSSEEFSKESLQTHDDLKRCAIQRLIEMGFDRSEIHTEYTFSACLFEKRIDVVGIKQGRKVAVECGTIGNKRAGLLLYLFFDEVYHLPYPNQKPDQSTLEEFKAYSSAYLRELLFTSLVFLEELRDLCHLSEDDFYKNWLWERFKAWRGRLK